VFQDGIVYSIIDAKFKKISSGFSGVCKGTGILLVTSGHAASLPSVHCEDLRHRAYLPGSRPPLIRRMDVYATPLATGIPEGEFLVM
jgi:hypothetical protein